MSIVFCLDCEREIDLRSHFKVGEVIKCPSCEIKMEIVSTDPLRLDWIYTGPTVKLSLFDEVKIRR
jgi:lysine biosynthesis protein LysW